MQTAAAGGSTQAATNADLGFSGLASKLFEQLGVSPATIKFAGQKAVMPGPRLIGLRRLVLLHDALSLQVRCTTACWCICGLR